MTMYTESLRAFLKPVLPYLDDDDVSEILINGPEDIWIERGGRLIRTDVRFTEEGLLGAARNMAQFVGRTITDERPRLDARLPDGSRIHVILPPIARQGATISIRKFFRNKMTMQSLVEREALTQAMSRLVDAAVQTKLNIVLSGGTGSGKTTLLNAVSSLIRDEERILTIEDSAELQLNQTHLVSLESRPADKYGKGGVDIGDLLHSALRLRPDRIIVGEVRGGECFHLLQAMNTGHGGSLATCHANTPIDTLRRLESLALMSTVELPLVAVRAQVASAIHLVICCDRLHDGSRRITHISEVLPLNEKGEYRTQDLWVFTPVTKDPSGKILGYHAPTGILPSFLPKAWAMGFTDLDETYFDPSTYGLPPPPIFHVGEQHTIRWAPSLRHREQGQADPERFKELWQIFERELKEEAASAPAPKAPRAASALATRPAPPRASPGAARADLDKTPPPTRHPTRPPQPPIAGEEPKVEVASDLLDEAEFEAAPPRRAPAPRRPAPAPRNVAVAPRRPVVEEEVEPDPEEEPRAVEDEKTAIRPAPTGPRR